MFYTEVLWKKNDKTRVENGGERSPKKSYWKNHLMIVKNVIVVEKLND